MSHSAMQAHWSVAVAISSRFGPSQVIWQSGKLPQLKVASGSLIR